jgi:hypothetical protein
VPKFVLSKRRLWAIITASTMVASLVIAAALIDRMGDETSSVVATAAVHELYRIDDLAAAAEARITVAVLRAYLIDPPRSVRNGPHARRLTEALAATLERDGRRADAWSDLRERFAAVQEGLKIGDPAARLLLAEFEAGLRTYLP